MKVDKIKNQITISRKEEKMIRIIKVASIFIILALILIIDITAYKQALNINTLIIEDASDSSFSSKSEDKEIVYFGVVSRFSPHIIYSGYQPAMDYLTENTKYHFKLKLSNSYEETAMMLANNEVEAAFLGTFIYATTRDKYNLKCIIKPLNEDGSPFFHSVLVTTDTSSIFSLRDLSGKRLALPSIQAFSGNWLPMYELRRNNLTRSDLSAIQHFPYHHMVIRQILRGNFDAGVVKDRVAKEFIDKGIRIIALSDPVPGSPIVAGSNSNPEIIAAIINAFLKINPKDEKYKKITKNWDIELTHGFIKANYKDYNQLAKLLESGGLEK